MKLTCSRKRVWSFYHHQKADFRAMEEFEMPQEPLVVCEPNGKYETGPYRLKRMFTRICFGHIFSYISYQDSVLPFSFTENLHFRPRACGTINYLLPITALLSKTDHHYYRMCWKKSHYTASFIRSGIIVSTGQQPAPQAAGNWTHRHVFYQISPNLIPCKLQIRACGNIHTNTGTHKQCYSKSLGMRQIFLVL